MYRLSSKLFEEIVDFLEPHMGIEQRRSLITHTFYNYPRLYNRIDWSGTNRKFTFRLVGMLLQYGLVEFDKPALIVMLQELCPQLSIENQHKIDHICQLLYEYEVNIYPPTMMPSRKGQSLKSLLRKLLVKLKPRGQANNNTDIENNSTCESIEDTQVASNDSLESPQSNIPLKEQTQPTRLRLDTAVPEKVDLERTFTVAVAVRQPDSQKLSAADLTNTNSEYAQVTWPSDDSVIDLRIEISAPECDIISTNHLSFQLYQDHDSSNFYFELKSKSVGQINIIIRLYHEQFILGSTRAKTMARSQQVSQVQVLLDSKYTDTSALMPSFKDSLQDRFDDFSTRKNLVAELLTCSTVRSRDTRDTIIDNLPNDIRSRIVRSQIDHIDVMNIVTRTLDYVNGLMDLLEVVRFYEGNSTPMNNVDAIVYLDF